MTTTEKLNRIRAKCRDMIELAKEVPLSFMSVQVAAYQSTIIAIDGFLAECKPFRFPDEDRPKCHKAINDILSAWPDDLL